MRRIPEIVFGGSVGLRSLLGSSWVLEYDRRFTDPVDHRNPGTWFWDAGFGL